MAEIIELENDLAILIIPDVLVLSWVQPSGKFVD